MTLQTERVARQDTQPLFLAFFLSQSTLATLVTPAVPHRPLLDPEWPPGATAFSTSWYLSFWGRGVAGEEATGTHSY